jgi:hypothetical protein
MAVGHVAADTVTGFHQTNHHQWVIFYRTHFVWLPQFFGETDCLWWFLGTFAKLCKATVSFVMSVCLSVRPSICLHGTTWLSLYGFMWNLIFMYFSKICWENSSFIKIWQE